MFSTDLVSHIPTDRYNAQEAYEAYWAVATSEHNIIANGTSPVYRFARELMLRTIMDDYRLTVAEAVWLYECGPLAEGPTWGSLQRMVDYGREENFGRERY